MSAARKPLEGRRVVVTRAEEQAGDLASLLEALGAEVLLLPLVTFLPATDPAPLDRALHGLESFDWLFLTSGNAVRHVAARARLIGVELGDRLAPRCTRPRVAAVGFATGRAALAARWRVDFASSLRGGRDLAGCLSHVVRDQRILLPRSDRASADLPLALSNAGATPVEVVAYHTVAPKNLDPEILGQIARGEVDVVSFASPSEFETLVAQLGEARLRQSLHSVLLAVIGSTTASAIRQAGFGVAIEPAIPSVAGLAESIAAYFVANPVARKVVE